MKKLAFPLVLIVLGGFLLSAVVRSWYNPSGAHGQRQVDTTGMGLALYLDYAREGPAMAARSLLYPRVLQRGLSTGRNAAEFPALSFLTAPFFGAGAHWGSVLSTLLILVLNALGAFVFLPRLWRSVGVQHPAWLAALAYFSLGSVEFQSSIVMPEGLAFPCLVAGGALLLSGRWAGALCLALAVAVKPTAVVAYPALALFAFRAGRSSGTRALVALALSLVFGAWWYGPHTQEILKAVDGPQFFAQASLHPLARLREVGWAGFFELLWRQLNTWQFPFMTGALWTIVALTYEPVAFMALLAMLACAIALDGSHIWFHAYYFFGASIGSLLIIGRILARGGKPRWLQALCVASLVWGVVYATRTNVWVTARTDNGWNLAERLAPSIPPDAHVVTDDIENTPTKLLLLGREGTLGGPSLAEICHEPRYNAIPLAFVVDRSTFEALRGRPGSCFQGTSLIRSVRAPFASWMLVVRGPN